MGYGRSNWKIGFLAGSVADVEFSTDGDGSSWDGSSSADRRWGFQVMFLPFDMPMPSASVRDAFFADWEKETEQAEGFTKPMELERDNWDETRLRNLCKLHGWEFSWMTEDSEFQRRTTERASFEVHAGEMEKVKQLADNAMAKVASFLAPFTETLAEEPQKESEA